MFVEILIGGFFHKFNPIMFFYLWLNVNGLKFIFWIDKTYFNR